MMIFVDHAKKGRFPEDRTMSTNNELTAHELWFLRNFYINNPELLEMEENRWGNIIWEQIDSLETAQQIIEMGNVIMRHVNEISTEKPITS